MRISADAQRFLNILGRGERFTFQICDDSPLKRADLALICRGPLEMYQTLFHRLNGHGANISVMINRGDERGRQVRALFVSTHNAPITLLLDSPLQPHLVVETSPFNFDAYFLVSDMNPNDFSRFQNALARYFGGDESINDLCHVMPLPGFNHQKTGRPSSVRVLRINNDSPYLTAELVNALGPNLEEPINKEFKSVSKNKALPKELWTVNFESASQKKGIGK